MTPLILLHGAPGEGPLWQTVVDRLGPHVEAVCPTLTWFGADPWPDMAEVQASFGTGTHSAELIALIEARGLGPVAVAAWSFSCHVVLDALLKRPDLFDKVLLVEPGMYTYLTDAGDIEAFGADAQAAFGPIGATLQEKGPEAAVEKLFESSGGPGCFALLSSERQARYLANARIMPLLMGGGQPPANITAADLARIDRPVTVAHGRQTRPLFSIASRAVASAIPGARLDIIEDADHMLPEKDPARFAAYLSAWLG